MQISIRPAGFDGSKLVCLAEALKKKFPGRQTLAVTVFSSHEAARHWRPFTGDTVGGPTKDWAAEMLGTYFFSAETHVEYVELLPQDPNSARTRIDLSSGGAQPAPGTWKTYVSPKKAYSLNLPSDWTVQNQQTPWRVEPSEQSIRADAPDARVGVLINATKLDATETIETFYSLVVGGYRRWAPRTFKIVEEKDFTAGPLRGKKLIYSFVSQDQHHRRVENRVFYLVDRGRVATITVSARTPEEFALHEHLFDDIAASFRFGE